MKRLGLAAVIAALMATAACTGSSDAADNPGNCTVVNTVVSSEKVELLTALAKGFNGSKAAAINGGCAFVRVSKKASGSATQLLAGDWPDPDANGPQPAIWSPASSAWISILNQSRAQNNAPVMTGPATSFMNTPLVIAMPRKMAEALGWPNTPIGYADIVALAKDPQGWAAKGHPEWGQFKLGKTNPNYSTSGLHFTIAEYYAATNKTKGLSLEDLKDPAVSQYARDVESSVVHYGDITMTFLNNWFRNDARGTALQYVSAVGVEEKSVIDYNRGNPDGILDPGEKPRPPREPLVAIYPKEGTLFSDNPLMVVNAPWVSAKAKEGAQKFIDFVRQPDNQRKVLEYGFRPGNPSVSLAAPIAQQNGVDPNQPQNLLELPTPPVLTGVLEQWAQVRKSARVLMVIDVSGSMGDSASDSSTETKLDLAKRAAINSLGQFADTDQVGLRIFSTGISRNEPTDYLDVVPVAAMSQNREVLRRRIDDLVPTRGTPLYTVTGDSFRTMERQYDPQAINAIVLLTDGRNEDPRNSDLNKLVATLRADSEGESQKPVRIFTIGYGQDANATELREISDATNAAYYSASNPTTIDAVFQSVVSNF
ncbi:MAG: extracellular solute-binding protein [Acidimicrobiia bacterium]